MTDYGVMTDTRYISALVDVRATGEFYSNVGDGLIRAEMYRVVHDDGLAWGAVAIVAIGWALTLGNFLRSAVAGRKNKRSALRLRALHSTASHKRKSLHV